MVFLLFVFISKTNFQNFSDRSSKTSTIHSVHDTVTRDSPLTQRPFNNGDIIINYRFGRGIGVFSSRKKTGTKRVDVSGSAKKYS